MATLCNSIFSPSCGRPVRNAHSERHLVLNNKNAAAGGRAGWFWTAPTRTFIYHHYAV